MLAAQVAIMTLYQTNGPGAPINAAAGAYVGTCNATPAGFGVRVKVEGA